MKFPTIHIHTLRSENALTKSYKFGHYMSFLKVNKITFFFPKLITWAWNIKMRWDQTGWLDDIPRFLKNPKTPPKVQNWRSYALLKLSIFPKLPKVNYPQNSNFWQKGPLFSTWFGIVIPHTCPIFNFMTKHLFFYFISFLLI